MKIEDKINKVLNKIRPYLQNDGGNVEFLRYENGVAYVRLTGACSNCPLADHTLESGIESALTNEGFSSSIFTSSLINISYFSSVISGLSKT